MGSFEKEVDVNISMEAICSALSEEVDTTTASLQLLNCCAMAMKAITDEMIAGMSEMHREAIFDFLCVQNKRYGKGETCVT